MHHEYNFESFFPREISHLKSTVIQNSMHIWTVSSLLSSLLQWFEMVFGLFWTEQNAL